jgi:hypothetical protein
VLNASAKGLLLIFEDLSVDDVGQAAFERPAGFGGLFPSQILRRQ